MHKKFIVTDGEDGKALVPRMPKTAARALLTAFLKSRRARLSPSELGFQDENKRRRTQGLRRSEAARLAGVSTEWYTLFEMGRERAMTQRIIEPVARALRLDVAERDYLYDLVRGEPLIRENRELHPSIDFALKSFRDSALSVYDPWLTRLRWNAVAQEIFMIESGGEWIRHNLLWRLFTDRQMQKLGGDAWREHARRNVGLFRRSLARDPLNPDAHTIITALTGIAEFDELWSAHDVYSFEMYSHACMTAPYDVHHPRYGRIALQAILLEIPGWPGAHVRYMTPADDASAEVLRGIPRDGSS